MRHYVRTLKLMSIVRTATGDVGIFEPSILTSHRSSNRQYHVMTSKYRKSLAEIWKDHVQSVHTGFLNLFVPT
jgi:hypothetical protein